ncbi:MAG: hypothetical protein QM296_05080 [Bacillota bacterium]|nr:hypothetical protein [Bacillota bacterium]
MFLKKTRQSSGRILLTIARGYRDPVTKKSRQKTVVNLGYLDELLKQYEDPIAHFEQVAKEMTEAEKKEKKARRIDLGTIDLDEELDPDEDSLRMLGFLPFSRIYHELEIDRFLVNRQRSQKIDYSLNDVMQLLVYSRLLTPGTKLQDNLTRNRLGRSFRCDEYDLYRALGFFASYREALTQHVHESLRMQYGRKSNVVYCALTGYCFENDREDEFRRRGCCSHNTCNRIVQMGLLLDEDAIPMTYALHEANSSDVSTLMPLIQDMRNNYDIERMVLVADKTLNSGDNVACLLAKADGFIFSQKIRGATEEFQNYVFDPSGYRTLQEPEQLCFPDTESSGLEKKTIEEETAKASPNDEEKDSSPQKEDVFRVKSRPYPQTFWVTLSDDKKRQIPVNVRQIVYYSPSYASLQRQRREETLNKARQLLQNPSLYDPGEHFGARRFIKNLSIDEKTGAYIKTKSRPVLDIEAIEEDAKYDGYCALITSEEKMPVTEVIRQYHELWQIDRSFRISKSQLITEPIFLSREQRMEAHFLVCFLSLLILRLLSLKMQNKYSQEQMIHELQKMNSIQLQENLMKRIYRSKILDEIGEAVCLDFTKRYLTYGELRSMVAKTKKRT